MRYRMSGPNRVFTFGCAGAGAIILSLSFVSGNFLETLGALSILGTLLIIRNLGQSGYRVAWDDKAIHLRKWGVLNSLNINPEITSIRWDEICGYDTSILGVPPIAADYRTDEFLKVYCGSDKMDYVAILPFMINIDDFEEFSNFFAKKTNTSLIVDLH